MMMKGNFLSEQQQQQIVVMDENLSNLTSASGEATASVSSANKTEFPNQYFAPQSQPPPPPPPKKKRNLPGNPDPDAEVIALSPKTLMATNRFVCEICNKGFQRDQNLQLHRRGHNLPWKLKQRTNKEIIKKKVYVCPEVSCVHHDPSRALGDLTGIKKHFCRKHGEKKWKCDKCSKKYAVQSDWKAHSKICGTKEYRCDCGTLFSRRDSFITHRAFCDALADESARSAMALNPLLSSYNSNNNNNSQEFLNNNNFALKRDFNNNNNNNLRAEIPPWLQPSDLRAEILMGSGHEEHNHETLNPNPNPSGHGCGPTSGLPPPAYQSCSPHISATALLQKAAQMGATMSSTTTTSGSMPRPHKLLHVSTGNYGEMGLWSREVEMGRGGGAVSCSSSSCTDYGNKAANANASASASASTTFLHDMINSLSSPSPSHPFLQHNSSFNDTANAAAAFSAMHHHTAPVPATTAPSAVGSGSRSDGLTRDFLGLRPLSHGDILSLTGFGNCIVPNNSSNLQTQIQKPWQG
ncbi:protein indeterminate-domain 7-like [Benincasa hispida]|uniref:protein indeterminate-domain 7-like n=1 Tax=Benincasa hispida TaxID=102211 RepID=UPI0019020DF3|nr:protein indeterminate-domain 7-like [Benincasa hispida]